VEAADNVVHAYDLNMEIPDTPMDDIDEAERTDSILAPKLSKSRVRVLDKDIPLVPRLGTKRSRSVSTHFMDTPAAKHRAVVDPTQTSLEERPRSLGQHPLHQTVQECNTLLDQPQQAIPDIPEQEKGSRRQSEAGASTKSTLVEDEGTSTPGKRNTKIRDLLHYMINESLAVGGRPESAIAVDTQLGESIEVRTKSSGGTIEKKTIEWKVDSDVPDTFLGI
jgi:hypothetical protein